MSFLPNQAGAVIMLREALLQCYLSGQMSAAQWERHCEDDPELRTMVEAKGGDANDRVPIQRRPEDTSPGVKTGATDSIAAMREALGVLCDEIEATEEHGAAAFEDFCPVCKAIDGARAALVAYDAAATPSRQSADIEAIARELALKFRRPFSSEKLIEELLSFAARVAADQRERFVEAVNEIEALSRKWGDPNGTNEQQAIWDHGMCRIMPRLRAALGKRGEG